MKQEKIWNYFLNRTPERFRRSKTRQVYLANKAKPHGKVLNIGVGGGVFEETALERGLDVYSLDPNEEAIAAIRQRWSVGEKAKVSSCEEIRFADGFFGAVVISEVIEHLSAEATEATVREIARVLRRGGRIIGTVPGRENLEDQIVICPDCGKRFHRWGHVQSFDQNAIRELLSRHFDVEKVFERPFPDRDTLNWKGMIYGLLQRLLAFLGMHGQNENIVFVARKR